MATANPYAQYQWRDDPARKVTSQFSTATAPAFGAQNVAQGAQPTKPDAVNGAAVASPWSVSGGGQQPKPFVVPGTQQSGQQGSFASLIANAQAPRAENMTSANQAIGQMLAPSVGPSAEGSRALSDLDKQQAEQTRQVQEQSALSGRMATGQSQGDTLRLSERIMANRADAVGQVAASDAERNNQRQQQGLSSFLSMESLGQQAQASQAQLDQAAQQFAASYGLSRDQLSETMRQFDTKLDFDKWATQAGIDQKTAEQLWQSSENDKARASQEKLGFADLSIKEKSLAQEGQQFKDELSFKKYATDRGFTDAEMQRAWQSIQNQAEITSREKLGFADLTVKEKQLAQDGAQFKDELAFKKYATDRGFTDAEAQRAWQATQNQAEITSREKLGFAGLSIQEKELAQQGAQFNDRLSFDKWATQAGLDDKSAERIWQANENQLGRSIQQYIADKGFDIDEKQLTETVRQFDSKQSFDKWATQAGLDQQASELVWKSNENDIQRKYESGERLSTEEHQVNLQKLQGDIDTNKVKLQQVLNLQTMEQQNNNDLIMADVQNRYQVNRDTSAMTHEQAMTDLKQNYAIELQKAGFGHDESMQAAEIYASNAQKEMDREMQTLEARAELAYKYEALASQEGLSKQEIELKRETMNNQMSLGMEQLGLDKKKVEAALKSDEFNDRAGSIATFMEMAGDNKDAMDRAVNMYLELLGDPKLPGGALLTKEEIQAAKQGLEDGTLADVAAQTEADKAKYQEENKNAYDITKDASVGFTDQLAKGNVINAGKKALSVVKLIDPTSWW